MPKTLILTGVTGTRTGSRVLLSARTTTIGSASDCGIVLHDRMVAAHHAEVRQVLERWFIVPLEAGARIFVNGELVTSQGRLLEGDLLTLGTATFKASLGVTTEQAVGGTAGAGGIPRIGEYLVQRGMLTQNQVMRGMQRQQELQRQGRTTPLGDIFFDLGYISRYQLDQALQDQRGDFQSHFHD